MTAVRSPAKKVEEILLAHRVKVRLANDNAPNQVVLSGTVDTIEQAEAVLEAQGLRFQRLPVATAFHSSVVESAEKPFLDTLTREDICTPNISVYTNTTGLPYPDEPRSIRTTLSSQITTTVRFVEQINNMHQAGIRTFVEVGPGTVLSGLIRRILKGKEHTCISLNSKKTSDVTAFIHAIGRMWTLGIPMNIQNLWAEQFSVEAPRTELTVHRTEPSLAKVA